jgi:hypothetical protein
LKLSFVADRVSEIHFSVLARTDHALNEGDDGGSCDPPYMDIPAAPSRWVLPLLPPHQDRGRGRRPAAVNDDKDENPDVDRGISQRIEPALILRTGTGSWVRPAITVQ